MWGQKGSNRERAKNNRHRTRTETQVRNNLNNKEGLYWQVNLA